MLKEYAARLLQRHLGTDSLRRLSQKALEAQGSVDIFKDPCQSDIPHHLTYIHIYCPDFSYLYCTTLHDAVLRSSIGGGFASFVYFLLVLQYHATARARMNNATLNAGSSAQGGSGSFTNFGSLSERLVVVNHGWQSEPIDGLKGGWGSVFWSGYNRYSDHCSPHHNCWM